MNYHETNFEGPDQQDDAHAGIKSTRLDLDSRRL